MDGGSVIGHQTLIAARMAGYRPTDVWVACVPAGQRHGSFTHPEAMIGRMTGKQFVNLNAQSGHTRGGRARAVNDRQ